MGKSSLLQLTGGRLSIHLDENSYCRVERRKAEKWESICHKDPPLDIKRPVSYLLLDGRPIADFRFPQEEMQQETIRSEFGSGIRYTLAGTDRNSFEVPVSQLLTVEIYDRFPDAAVIRSRFLAEGEFAPVSCEVVSGSILLDARRMGGRSPSDLWAYHGSAELREHCLQAVTPDFYKRNYLGVLESFDGGGPQPRYRLGSQPGFGGGIPLVAVWNPGLGTAIAHLEPSYRRCSLPVRAHRGGPVSIELVRHCREMLEPGRPVHSLETVLHLHEGDFFNALSNYREMMRCRSVTFSASAEAAYEPQWDTWGLGENFRPEEVLEFVPQLKQMGIRWITLDDRWFDSVGDWLPRTDRFPGGEAEFVAFIDALHREGMKVRLWTIPGEVDGDIDLDGWIRDHPQARIEVRKHPRHRTARFYKQHPGWIVRDPHGNGELSKRGYYFCCGCIEEVREHFRNVTRRMFGDWKIDGLKQDAVYLCPACYDEAHGHPNPDAASQAYGRILNDIYETAMELNPEAVIVNCPCGTTLTPDWMRGQNQALSPDPWTSWVNRGVVKQLKALFGPSAAVVLDHVELSDEGRDFALIGVGGVPATRITPDGREKTFGSAARLSFEEKKKIWTRWIRLYRKLMLSRGEYLNLYDLIYDRPETHVIRVGEKLYYAFYPGEPDGIRADQRDLYEEKKSTKHFSGTLEFRGLEREKTYRVYDYEHQAHLGEIRGCDPHLKVEIDHHLLVEVCPSCTPKFEPPEALV